MGDNLEERIAFLQERLGKVEQSSSAAHARLDKDETMMRETLGHMEDRLTTAISGVSTAIKEDMKTLSDKVDDVTAWMDQGKGAIAVISLAALALGFILARAWTRIFGP